MNQNLTDFFIDGLVAKSQAIPEKVIQQAKKCLLDYIGVVVGGARYLQEHHPIFFDSFKKDSGCCSLFGADYKTTAANAALLNGFSAHVLELDDGHRKGMIHLGASIFSAVLAVAEQEKLDTNAILRGVVMGYEAAVCCACALQPGHKVRGYHVSGTCGVVGSAMGVAFACGYTKEQIKTTLACAATSTAGLLEIQEEASELKPYNLGRAALDGLIAGQMGRMALPGPDDVLGGRRGLLAVLTDTPNPEHLTDFSKENYCIEGIYQKLHAACRHCHPAIDATINMRNDFNLKPEQIEKIEVNTYKLAVGSHNHTQIMGISSAKLSTPYAVALAIVRGSAGYADYNEANLDDYNIKMLTHKVVVVEDENLTSQSPTIRGAIVTIYLKNGEAYKAQCLYPKGEPEHPLTQEELKDKFIGLAMYGGLTKGECDKVITELQKNQFDLNSILSICKIK